MRRTEHTWLSLRDRARLVSPEDITQCALRCGSPRADAVRHAYSGIGVPGQEQSRVASELRPNFFETFSVPHHILRHRVRPARDAAEQRLGGELPNVFELALENRNDFIVALLQGSRVARAAQKAAPQGFGRRYAVRELAMHASAGQQPTGPLFGDQGAKTERKNFTRRRLVPDVH